MKAILVIDMPDEAKAEDYYMKYGLFLHKADKPYRISEVAFQYEKVDLKPLPNKKHNDENNMEEACYMDGWNACIDEITGESNG